MKLGRFFMTFKLVAAVPLSISVTSNKLVSARFT